MKNTIKLLSLLSLFLLVSFFKDENIAGGNTRNKLRFVCDDKLLVTQAKWLNESRAANIIFWRDQNWLRKDGTTLKQKCIDVSAAFQKAYQENKLKRIIPTFSNGRSIICASQDGKQCDYPLYSLLPGENTAVEVAQQLFKRIFYSNSQPLRHSDFSLDMERFLFGNQITKKNQILCPVKQVSTSSPSDLAPSITDGNIFKNVRQFTIKIDAVDSQGSGVIFARQGDVYCVLTAKHNILTSIQLNRSIRIITPDGIQYEAQNPRVAPNNIDLAILEFVSNKKPGYEIATIGNSKQTSLLPKQTIYIAGFPVSKLRDSTEAFISEGKFDADSEKSFDITYTPSDSEAAATFGMSGGAIVDAQGILIGIHGAGESISAKTTIFSGIATNSNTLSKMASTLGLNFEASRVATSPGNSSPAINTQKPLMPNRNLIIYPPSPPKSTINPSFSTIPVPSIPVSQRATITSLVIEKKCPGCNLAGQDFRGLKLPGADLYKANLQDVNFSFADLSNVNLSEANLEKADLGHTKLNNANLSGANLKRAALAGAKLNKANLSGANLQNANLSFAELDNADLRGADLRNADLEYAKLRNIQIDEKTNFDGAKIRNTSW